MARGAFSTYVWLSVTGWVIAGRMAQALEPAVAPRLLDSWSLGGFVEGYRIVEVDHSTARQRPAALVDLNLRGELLPWLQVYVDSRSLLGGTPEHADGFGVFNLSDTFQNISPSLEIEEAYLEARFADLDVRIGKQKFASGRLDLFRPTDVLNPRRYNDPFVMEDDDAKVGVPAVKLAYYLPPQLVSGDYSATLMWLPLPVAFRMPLQDERWFPPSANVPDAIVIPADFFGLASGATIQPVLRTANAPPPQQLDEGALALRVAGSVASAEWSLSAYHGPETAPALGFSTDVYSPSAQEKVRTGERPSIPGGDLKQLIGDATLQPRYHRITLVGADLAVPWHGFTTRFEAAYGWNRLVPRSTQDLLSLDNIRATVGPNAFEVVDTILRGAVAPVDLGDLFVERNRLDWGAGIDYVIDGWIPLLQVNQSVLTDDSNQRLLVAETDTRLLLALRKSLFAERLKIDLVGFQGIERSYSTAIARFSFALTDQLRARFGYVLIAGTRESVIGQYHDLDEAFFQIRYSF